MVSVYLTFFIFIGEFVVNLQNALLDNAMIWYELESPNHSKASKSPRSSISETGKGGLRSQIRSVSGTYCIKTILFYWLNLTF